MRRLVLVMALVPAEERAQCAFSDHAVHISTELTDEELIADVYDGMLPALIADWDVRHGEVVMNRNFGCVRH